MRFHMIVTEGIRWYWNNLWPTGAALIAFKMFKELSLAAEALSEVELHADLQTSAKYVTSVKTLYNNLN